MAEDPNVHPHWAAETKAIARNLNRLDYFQVLGASPESTVDELKSNYYQLQRNYHPDSFFSSPDKDLQSAVKAIAKRVTEAYVILRDPAKRRKYIEDIRGPHRSQRLRYGERSDREARQEGASATTPQGRQLWTKALAALRMGNYVGAERDLKTALIFESDNDRIQSKLEEVQAHLRSPSPH